MKELRLFVSAGEPSGDTILAQVLRQLQLHRHLALQGLGGPQSESFGFHSLFPFSAIALSGIGDVLIRLPYLLKVLRRCTQAMQEHRPEAVLLVDYPGLNMRLLKRAKRFGYPVLFISPPQVWAYRNRKVSQRFDGVHVQVLFPMEIERYRERGAHVSQGSFFHSADLSNRMSEESSQEILLICPGSRRPVLERNLHPLLELSGRIAFEFEQRDPKRTPPIPVVLVPPYLEAVAQLQIEQFQGLNGSSNPIQIETELGKVSGRTRMALALPGTLTLQLALLKVPFIGVAWVDRFTLWVGKRLVRTDRLLLPNVLTNKEYFPQMIGLPGCVPCNLEQLLDQALSAPLDQAQQELLPALGEFRGDEIASKTLLQIAN